MYLKRILALLLICAFIVPMLFACNNTDAPESGNDPVDSTDNESSGDAENDSEETEDLSKSDLPDIKWDGEVFNVLGNLDTTYTWFSNFEIVYDEENLGEGVNDAIFKRNTKLESQYDVKITQDLVDNIADALHTNSISGDQLYDLTFETINEIGTHALEGYLYDLNQMKYIDFTKNYWNKEVNDTVSIADRIYFTTSDFALRDKARAYILFYNPELAETGDIPDIVPLVREGKWTVDLMGEYADRVDRDLTGEGERSIYEDIYGFATDSSGTFAALMYGTDNMIVSRNEDNELTLVMNNERTIASIDKILTFYNNKNITHNSSGADWTAYSYAWYAGRVLFVSVFTHSLKTSTQNCEFDFNVIPFPKFDEAQDGYYTMANSFSMLFGIPTACKNPEFSSFMIEALSAESTDTSLYAYYDVACKTRYSYKPENGEMLDLIFDGIRYDPGLIYSIGGLYDIISATIPDSGQNVFSSLYKRKEARAIEKLTTIKDTLSALPY